MAANTRKVTYKRKAGKWDWTARRGKNILANSANQRYSRRVDCVDGLIATAEILTDEVKRLASIGAAQEFGTNADIAAAKLKSMRKHNGR